MGTAVRDRAVTDRVKIFGAKLGFGTDAFTGEDFEGAVFLRLGDPTDIFFYQGPP